MNGFDNEDTGMSSGQSKVSPTNQESVSVPDNTNEEISGELKKAGASSSFVRGTTSGHKSKHSARGQKGIRSKISPEWKVVGLTSVDGLAQSALEERKQKMPTSGSSESMEFKAGVFDLGATMNRKVEELRPELTRFSDPSPNLLRNESATECTPLGASSNAPTPGKGKEMDCAKDAAARIAEAHLKRIDPGARSVALSQAHMLEDDPGVCLGPEVSMHAEEGGDVPSTSR
ncbi:hypothetical protein ACB092_03G068300 [Castanea dentata]